MYASRDDMVKRFGQSELIALTDRSRTGQIDNVVVDRALADASVEIDGYVGSRYALPLSPAPDILRGIACDIARYRLCGAGTLTTDDIRDRFTDARRYLERVAEGKVMLTGLPSGGAATTSDTVQFNQGTRVFARDAGAY